jgi:hypothetical protein
MTNARPDPPMTDAAQVSSSQPPKAPIFGSGFGKPQEGGTPFGKPQEGGVPSAMFGSGFGKPQEGGTPFGKPQEGGTPFGKPQEGGTPFGKPQEGGTPFGKPQEGGTPFGKPQEGGVPSAMFGSGFGKPQEGGTPFGKPQKGDGDKWSAGEQQQQQEATTPETTNSVGGSDAGRDGQDLREEGRGNGDEGGGKVFGGFKPGFLSPKSADGGGNGKSGVGPPLSPLLGNFRQGGGRGASSASPRGSQDSKEGGGGGTGAMPQDPFAVLKDTKSSEGGAAKDLFAGLKDAKSPFKSFDDADGKEGDETMGPFGKVDPVILPSLALNSLCDLGRISFLILIQRVWKALSSLLCPLSSLLFSCSSQRVQVL